MHFCVTVGCIADTLVTSASVSALSNAKNIR